MRGSENASRPAPHSCRLSVHAVPNASRNEVAGRHLDAVKIKIRAVPEDGRANAALIEFLAEKTGLPRRNITLVRGDTNRSKLFAIDGLSLDEVLRRLGLST
jgi:hypothetical protein